MELEFNELLAQEREQAYDVDDLAQMNDFLAEVGHQCEHTKEGNNDVLSIPIRASNRTVLINTLQMLEQVEHKALTMGWTVDLQPAASESADNWPYLYAQMRLIRPTV